MKHHYSKRLDLILIAVGGVILPCLIALVAWNLTYASPEDATTYKRLLSGLNERKNGPQSEQYEAKQKRVNVQKDILYMKDADRLQVRLTAADSRMVLDHHDGENNMIEHMNDMRCAMQEELYYVLSDGREAFLQENGQLLIRHSPPSQPESWIAKNHPGLKPMQIVRFIEAETASYYYKTEFLKAEDVNISRFSAEGHALMSPWEKKQLLMKGIAESMEFSLSDKTPNFKASEMKTTLYLPEKSS